MWCVLKQDRPSQTGGVPFGFPENSATLGPGVDAESVSEDVNALKPMELLSQGALVSVHGPRNLSESFMTEALWGRSTAFFL